MPLDPSIILSGQQPQLQNPLDAAVKAQSLKSMILQNQSMQKQYDDQNSMSDIMKRSLTVGADGKPAIDKKSALSEMYKVNPLKALEQEKQWKAEDFEAVKQRHDVANTLAFSIAPDGSNYKQVIQQAISMGIPNAEKAPAEFDPDWVKNLQGSTLSYKERTDQMDKDRNFNQKERELGLKHDENAIKRDQVHGDKVNKRFDDFAKDMDPDRGRAGNFGQASAKVMQAQHLTALSDKLKSGLDLTPAEMEEYALGAANLISGSAGSSRSQVEALVPHSGVLDANKVLSYITNDPRGAGQQKFVQQMHDSVTRQQDVSQEQLDQIRAGRLANYNDLKKADPEKFKNILESKGFDISRLDEKGRYKAKTGAKEPSAVQAASHPEAQTAIEWAKANPQDPRAAAIIQRLGQ